MRYPTLLAATLSLLVGAPALAQDAPPPAAPAAAMGGAKYGLAGCGLGSLAFGAKPGMIQVLAATTNGTFGTQTFGISSGTSNCEEMGGGSASVKAFVAANRETLSKDIARGSGETVTSLSTLAGCQDAQAVGVSLQKSFQSIFPNAGVSDQKVGQSIVSTLKADPVLACKKII